MNAQLVPGFGNERVFKVLSIKQLKDIYLLGHDEDTTPRRIALTG